MSQEEKENKCSVISGVSAQSIEGFPFPIFYQSSVPHSSGANFHSLITNNCTECLMKQSFIKNSVILCPPLRRNRIYNSFPMSQKQG